MKLEWLLTRYRKLFKWTIIPFSCVPMSDAGPDVLSDVNVFILIFINLTFLLHNLVDCL